MKLNLLTATILIILFTIVFSYIIAKTFSYFENEAKCEAMCGRLLHKTDFWGGKCYCGFALPHRIEWCDSKKIGRTCTTYSTDTITAKNLTSLLNKFVKYTNFYTERHTNITVENAVLTMRKGYSLTFAIKQVGECYTC